MESKEGFIPLSDLPDLLKEQFRKQSESFAKVNMDKIIDQILPHTKAEATCLQKKMIKERNRAMLQRMLKTIAENPYERYTFDIKK